MYHYLKQLKSSTSETHQDNTSVQKSVNVIDADNDWGFEIIEHPHNSHDISPSDFHLFLKLKNSLLVSC